MFDFLVQFLMSLSSSSLKFWHGGGLLRAAPWIKYVTYNLIYVMSIAIYKYVIIYVFIYYDVYMYILS